MTALVTGGAGSGKSAWAENLLCALAPDAPRVYLATMEPFGGEARERIERHRAMRREKGFVTVEHFTDIGSAAIPPHSAVLLEDVGNLCANELFSTGGAGESAADAILRGIAHVKDVSDTLVIVSNEVFTGGRDYAGDTEKYMSLLSCVNRKLAAMADFVCEVSCALATYYKGESSDVGA